MSFDIAFRHQQALDPSALTTIQSGMHALEAAITDCRNAGRDFETDPAVLLLARHLGALATDGQAPTVQLRRASMDAIAELRRRPVLLVLWFRGVGYDAPAKKLFHAEGRRALRRLADALHLPEERYVIRSNQGGIASSGEITLHGDVVYVQLSLDCRGADSHILYRRVEGRSDYRGGRNHWASVRDLLAPDRFADRIRRELDLTEIASNPVRLFA